LVFARSAQGWKLKRYRRIAFEDHDTAIVLLRFVADRQVPNRCTTQFSGTTIAEAKTTSAIALSDLVPPLRHAEIWCARFVPWRA